MNEAVQAPSTLNPPEPDTPGLSPDLARLFRHALRDSRIHPLMPMVQSYRKAAASASPPADPSS
jgi:hypothetical protein